MTPKHPYRLLLAIPASAFDCRYSRISVTVTPIAALTLIAAATVKPGAKLDCRTVAEMQPPESIDNMEGLAVRVNEKGETIVYMISDDNFSRIQRTVLLVFRLEPEALKR